MKKIILKGSITKVIEQIKELQKRFTYIKDTK